MGPYIGITAGSGENGDIFLRKQYCEAVVRAGGVPVILPFTADPYRAVKLCDGLIFSGGGDICEELCIYDRYLPELIFEPSYERDKFELTLARLAYENDLPTLGICRGMQVMNTALGGSLLFDIPHHRQTTPRDTPSHIATVKPGSYLASLTGINETGVNSFHHQAVDRPGKGLTVSSVSEDGITEAVEAQDRRFFIGVQWHPEHLRDNASKKLFAALCRAAVTD